MMWHPSLSSSQLTVHDTSRLHELASCRRERQLYASELLLCRFIQRVKLKYMCRSWSLLASTCFCTLPCIGKERVHLNLFHLLSMLSLRSWQKKINTILIECIIGRGRAQKKTKNNVVALNVLFNSSDHFERRSTNNNTVVSQPSFFLTSVTTAPAVVVTTRFRPSIYVIYFGLTAFISTRNTQQTKLHNIL